jgi:hypothetical protein
MPFMTGGTISKLFCLCLILLNPFTHLSFPIGKFSISQIHHIRGSDITFLGTPFTWHIFSRQYGSWIIPPTCTTLGFPLVVARQEPLKPHGNSYQEHVPKLQKIRKFVSINGIIQVIGTKTMESVDMFIYLIIEHLVLCDQIFRLEVLKVGCWL